MDELNTKLLEKLFPPSIENEKLGVPPKTFEKVISPSLDPLQLTPKPLYNTFDVTSALNVIGLGSATKTESEAVHPFASVIVISWNWSPHKLLKTDEFWDPEPFKEYVYPGVPVKPGVIENCKLASQTELHETIEFTVMLPSKSVGSFKINVSSFVHRFASL